MTKNQELNISNKTGIVEYLFIISTGLFITYCVHTMFSLFSSL